MSYWWDCPNCGTMMQYHTLDSPCWNLKENIKNEYHVYCFSHAHFGDAEDKRKELKQKWVDAGYPLEELIGKLKS